MQAAVQRFQGCTMDGGCGCRSDIHDQQTIQRAGGSSHRSMSHNNNNGAGQQQAGVCDRVQMMMMCKSANQGEEIQNKMRKNTGKQHTEYNTIQNCTLKLHLINYNTISRGYLRIILSYYRMTDSINNIVIHMGIIQPHRNEIQYCM